MRKLNFFFLENKYFRVKNSKYKNTKNSDEKYLKIIPNKRALNLRTSENYNLLYKCLTCIFMRLVPNKMHNNRSYDNDIIEVFLFIILQRCYTRISVHTKPYAID